MDTKIDMLELQQQQLGAAGAFARFLKSATIYSHDDGIQKMLKAIFDVPLQRGKIHESEIKSREIKLGAGDAVFLLMIKIDR